MTVLPTINLQFSLKSTRNKIKSLLKLRLLLVYVGIWQFYTPRLIFIGAFDGTIKYIRLDIILCPQIAWIPMNLGQVQSRRSEAKVDSRKVKQA